MIKEKIGILYSTVDGHTLKICRHIAENIEKIGINTDLIEISSFNGTLFNYSALVIGASIRYGKHNNKVTQFINDNKCDLEKINTAFFSVNLVARKKDKNSFNSNPYVIKFFKHIDWKPKIIDVFAGRLDYNSYSLLDRLLIKLIMKITNGPTKAKEPIEFTDWKRVENFSVKVCEI